MTTIKPGERSVIMGRREDAVRTRHSFSPQTVLQGEMRPCEPWNDRLRAPGSSHGYVRRHVHKKEKEKKKKDKMKKDKNEKEKKKKN